MTETAGAKVAAVTEADLEWFCRGSSTPGPGSSAKALIALACEMLPTIDDSDVADLVELLALALADANDALLADLELQTVMLSFAYDSKREESRVRERYHAVLNERRKHLRASS